LCVANIHTNTNCDIHGNTHSDSYGDADVHAYGYSYSCGYIHNHA
jgi:hypothetical protein